MFSGRGLGKMREFYADLHFHSPYAGGVSKNMSIPTLAQQAELKGLNVICTADVTHKTWLSHLKEHLVEENGTYAYPGTKTRFIVGTELEDANRVHHLVYLEDLSRAEELRENVSKFGKLDYWGAGRPKLKATGEQLAEIVFGLGGVIGPAHAFTPYFSAYAHFDSIKKCYGSFGEKISFVELGLSADSLLADLVRENHDYNFVTFSDSHSPWPHRIGREFTKMRMKEPSFKELKKVFGRSGGREITLNAGLNPKEGKYHATACNSCYEKFPPEKAAKMNWRCHCGGAIKKGVRDRISELASFSEETHPPFRPPYMHMLPLAEIIQLMSGEKNVLGKKVQAKWRETVDAFGTEINVLLESPIVELQEADGTIARGIEAFRNGFVVYDAGGGGNYGRPFICASKAECEQKEMELEQAQNSAKEQRTLLDY